MILSAKAHAHQLIDRIPADQIPTAVRILEFMLMDPVARAAAMAPLDDEPVTEEDKQRLQRADRFFAEGKGIPMEEVLAEFGLALADFPPRLK